MTRFGAQLARTLLGPPLAWLALALLGVPRWQIGVVIGTTYVELVAFVLVGEREEGC